MPSLPAPAAVSARPSPPSSARTAFTPFDTLALDDAFTLDTDLLSVHGARDDIFPLAPLSGLQQLQGPRHELIVYPGEAHVCLNYINQYTIRIADWMAQRLQSDVNDAALAA